MLPHLQSCQEVADGGGGGGIPEQELYLQALFTLLDVLGRWVKDMLDTLSVHQGVAQQPQQQAVKQLVRGEGRGGDPSTGYMVRGIQGADLGRHLLQT